MPEDAVLDAAPLESGALDGGAHENAEIIDDSSVNRTESTDDGAHESGEPLRGSALWREVKSLTAEGKPLTQKQLSALNKAIHRANEIETRYPDGMKAVEGTLSAVQQLSDDPAMPIERVIQETLQERNYFRELDDLFTNGKPELADKLADASPEAFQNIAPAIFRKYAEVNPEGYASYVSQAVIQHMNSADVPLQFKLLATFLPQLPDSPIKEQVLNAVESIFATFEGLKAMAAKPIAQKQVNVQQNPQDQETNLQYREANATRKEWNADVKQEGVDLVYSEAQKVAGKTQLTESEKRTVLAKVGEEMEARLSADRRYGEAMQGYLRVGNRNAYVQRIQSERKKLVPGAVRRAVADVIEARPKKQVQNGNPQQNKVQKPAQSEAQPSQIFRKISGHPKTLGMQVDLMRTTNSMLQKGTAFVKGEKQPVQWANPVPKRA